MTKIVKLKGGLGNQLFQYSFAKYIQINSRDDVYLDMSGYDYTKNDNVRKPRILRFNITLPILTNGLEKNKCIFSHAGTYGTWVEKIKIVIEIAINRKYCFKKDCKFFPYDKTIKYNYFDGYWQSWKYVKAVEDILKEEICIPKIFEMPLKDEIDNCNAVFVGIRRGDYLKENKLYGQFDNNYYLKAMKLISEHVINPVFYIFSNDISWVKKNMNFENYIVKYRDETNVDDFEELLLMGSCKHAIIVNSTFYWWGAWLIKNPKKVVVAPKEWFANNWENDIVPEDWIRI